VYISKALLEAFGRPRIELLGHGWTDALDPEDRARFLALRESARAEHSSVEYEGRFLRPDGSLRLIQLYGRPRFDILGEFCGHVGLAKDVTEMRVSEEQRTALVYEVNHRVRNTLATVQSLVRHTLREHGSSQDVERAVMDRIMALSAAHNVLSRERWAGADVSDLVREVADCCEWPDRISTAGPRVRISPKSAIALAMGLQELATGAAAHGALSVPEGRVELDWTVERPVVALEWREVGGPPAAPEAASSFGAFLLGRMLAVDLGAPAEIVRGPDGLACRMRAPVLPMALA
jgi:PAS domain S-box-containing protein